ncbi:MAG TPA: hypothetical protein VLE47_03550 [Candidatus Saccharimonadales bacterium]|nr:hypothetical protein [Candidatus Saccharimonadales bacterium]
MGDYNQFNSPWVRLKNQSPMVWGFVLLFIATLLALIPTNFTRTFALLPLFVGGFFLYQAFFKSKY